MPHICLEYSENLSDNVNVPALLNILHHTVGEAESFELDRIKSRAVELTNYLVGSDEEKSALVHVTVDFSQRRTELVKQKLGQRLRERLDIGSTDCSRWNPVGRFDTVAESSDP